MRSDSSTYARRSSVKLDKGVRPLADHDKRDPCLSIFFLLRNSCHTAYASTLLPLLASAFAVSAAIHFFSLSALFTSLSPSPSVLGLPCTACSNHATGKSALDTRPLPRAWRESPCVEERPSTSTRCWPSRDLRRALTAWRVSRGISEKVSVGSWMDEADEG